MPQVGNIYLLSKVTSLPFIFIYHFQVTPEKDRVLGPPTHDKCTRLAPAWHGARGVTVESLGTSAAVGMLPRELFFIYLAVYLSTYLSIYLSIYLGKELGREAEISSDGKTI